MLVHYRATPSAIDLGPSYSSVAGIASSVRWTKSCALTDYAGARDSRSELRAGPEIKSFPKPHYKSFIDQAGLVKRPECWPRSLFAYFRRCRSVNKPEKNLANIQLSWPHSWSKHYTLTIPLSTRVNSCRGEPCKESRLTCHPRGCRIFLVAN